LVRVKDVVSTHVNCAPLEQKTHGDAQANSRHNLFFDSS
jgi:hypothetical protein